MIETPQEKEKSNKTYHRESSQVVYDMEIDKEEDRQLERKK